MKSFAIISPSFLGSKETNSNPSSSSRSFVTTLAESCPKVSYQHCRCENQKKVSILGRY